MSFNNPIFYYFIIFYIIVSHLFLFYIIKDRKNNRFFKYFGQRLYIINNYLNRKKNIYKSLDKKAFQNQYYNPIIESNQKQASESKNNIFTDIFQYISLYVKFILFIWWAYLIYIIIANILLFLDESLGD